METKRRIDLPVVKITGSKEEVEWITAWIETGYDTLRKTSLIPNTESDGVFHRFLTLKEVCE